METLENKVRAVTNILNDDRLYAIVYPSDIAVCVDISWGDWKHDHLRCDYLMKLNGYTHICTTVTEEDGSDCYSATHYYI